MNKKMAWFDRTDFTPAHVGQNVLPHSPFFSTLLRHAHVKGRVAVRDVNLGNRSWTYAELISDAIKLRSALNEVLPDKIIHPARNHGAEVYIGVLASGGYEYVVGVLAVLAMGFAIVPMTTALPVNEASYFVTKSRQICLLTSEDASELGRDIAKKVNADLASEGARLPRVQSIPILSVLRRGAHFLPPSSISISSDRYLSDNAPGLVIFTSGTTGPPKGAVLRRGYIHEIARDVEFEFGLNASDTLLNLLPVHHVTGLSINTLPFLLTGACIEFRSGTFDPEWTWNRFRDARVKSCTVFSAVPTIYMRLMRWYQAHLAQLPSSEREPYEAGVRQFRVMLCGTSALPRPVAQFWRHLRPGKGIVTRYGSTEIGAVLRVPLGNSEVPDGSCGRVAPGVELKLVDTETGRAGDEGEIVVKAPELFSKYLDDPEATRKSFTGDGWFMTGDIAKREGEWHWIVGRASQDIIKSGGYKISALDVEREILALPYVNEVSVMGVRDEEFGERVAALLTLRVDQPRRTIAISDLRSDLKSTMAGYKMPTLLRVMKGELPKTATGKVVKKTLGLKMFPPGWENEENVQAWKPHNLKI